MSLIEKFLRDVTDRTDQGINSDESVVFYPSVGTHPVNASDYRVQVRGRIYEEHQTLNKVPEVGLALAGVQNPKALAETIGRLAEDVECIRNFKQRAKEFVFDGERDEEVEIEIGGKRITNHRSNPEGFFGLEQPWHAISSNTLSAAIRAQDSPWVEYLAKGDSGSSFQGRSQLMRPHGVIVVSDIDDTIKDSNVPELGELILNTLFRPFRSTPGMRETYQAWQRQNAQFIYLSNSPYQLFRPLTEYLQGPAGYPPGAYYMRHVGLSELRKPISGNISFDEKVGLQENPKKHNLIPILEAFPNTNFVLVGDSTEQDADIYADLYLGQNFPAKLSALRKPYSDRIKKIYIRNVENSRRGQQALAALKRIPEPNVTNLFNAQNPNIQEDAAAVFQDAQRRRGASA